MNLSELNPQMGAAGLAEYKGCNQLTFDCPMCGGRVQIYCRLDSAPDEALRIWKWSYEAERYDWDAITITPSIGNHPVARNQLPCAAHFQITSGKVSY